MIGVLISQEGSVMSNQEIFPIVLLSNGNTAVFPKTTRHEWYLLNLGSRIRDFIEEVIEDSSVWILDVKYTGCYLPCIHGEILSLPCGYEEM